MRKLLIAFIAFAFSFSPLGVCLATTYYVDADADPGGDGSLSTPWDAVADVDNYAFSAGDTIYFDRSDAWDYSNELDITATGSSGSWITFDGETWDPESAGSGQAKLNWTSGGYYAVDIRYGSATDAYIKFKGFEVDVNNNDATPIRITNASYIQILNCVPHDCVQGTGHKSCITFDSTLGNGSTFSNLTVTGCIAYHSNAHGIAIYPDDSDYISTITVTDNIVYDWGNYQTYGSGIQIMSADGGTIARNVIYDGYFSAGDGGYGINLETRAQANNNLDIYKNIICGGVSSSHMCVGMENDGGTNIDVYSNVFYQCQKNAIQWRSESTGNVYGNTIYRTNIYSGDGAIYLAGGTIGNLKNNIIYQTADINAINLAGGSITTHTNNLAYNSASSGYIAVGSTTYANWLSYEASGQNSAPGFLNLSNLPTGFDSEWCMTPTGLRIDTGGAAYNNGTDLGSPFNIDIDGNNRTGSWDIGAYEYQAEEEESFLILQNAGLLGTVN